LRGRNGDTFVAHSQRHKCSALRNTLFESTRTGCWVTLAAPGAGDDFISKQFSGMAADTPAAFFAYLFLFHCWIFAGFLTAAAKSAHVVMIQASAITRNAAFTCAPTSRLRWQGYEMSPKYSVALLAC
jgi:hypothetical protein